MKRLTVIASLLLVPTFIVGLYGQNFIHIPELHWRFGYWWSWCLIIVDDDRPARLLPLEALVLGSPSSHAAFRPILPTDANERRDLHDRLRVARRQNVGVVLEHRRRGVADPDGDDMEQNAAGEHQRRVRVP